MKYIKTFEKHSHINLHEFCKDYLAYLLDDKLFKLSIKDNEAHLISDVSGGQSIKFRTNRRNDTIILEKYSIKHRTDIYDREFNDRKNINFTWDEIKDDLIPFLIMLDKEYRIVRISLMKPSKKGVWREGIWYDQDFKSIRMEDIEKDINILMNRMYITVKK